jgi:methionine synthase I (cobalamin-dependent)
MGYAKERGKLEKLSAKVNGLTVYDEKSLAVITDIYEQYSHTVRILKNKDTDTFLDLYQNDLQQVKEAKRALKQIEENDDRQLKFIEYRDVLSAALAKTIQTTKDTI